MRSSLESRALGLLVHSKLHRDTAVAWGADRGLWDRLGVTFGDCWTVWVLLSGHKGDKCGCDVVWSCPAAPQGHQTEE